LHETPPRGGVFVCAAGNAGRHVRAVREVSADTRDDALAMRKRLIDGVIAPPPRVAQRMHW
jgi:hypothetical protein